MCFFQSQLIQIQIICFFRKISHVETMVLVSFAILSLLSGSALILENHVAAWSVTCVHQVALNMHVRATHLLVILQHWCTLHTWVWLALRWYTAWGSMLLSVLLLLGSFHEVTSRRSLRWSSLRGHLLHHNLVHSWHLLGCTHSHELVLGLIVWVCSSLLCAHLCLGHHLSRLLLRSATRGLRLLHVLHFQTLFTY